MRLIHKKLYAARAVWVEAANVPCLTLSMYQTDGQRFELYSRFHGRAYSFELTREKCLTLQAELTHALELSAIEAAMPQMRQRAADFAVFSL